MVICVFQPQHLVKRVIAEAKGVSDVLHYSPNIVDLTVQLIELKRELFYFSPSDYIAQFVEVRDAELAKQSDNLFKGVSSECIDDQIELDLESLFVDIKICVERVVIIWGRREQECVRAQLLKRTGSKRPETAQPIDSRTGLQDRISNLF